MYPPQCMLWTCDGGLSDFCIRPGWHAIAYWNKNGKEAMDSSYDSEGSDFDVGLSLCDSVIKVALSFHLL